MKVRDEKETQKKTNTEKEKVETEAIMKGWGDDGERCDKRCVVLRWSNSKV